MSEQESNEGQLNVKEGTNKSIVLAGATGQLGQQIAFNLLKRGAIVKALVRSGSSSDVIHFLKSEGAQIIEADFNNTEQLVKLMSGASCVVSALSGLKEVIVDVQTQLLTAALQAGVPRFIPSDYCIDYTKLSYGSNRNLDLRREFSERIDKTSIKATSILNGMFTDLLTGQAPVILPGIKRVVYWGNARQPLDFTTLHDTAVYTAAAALDADTPRWLRIAGEVTTAEKLCKTASEVMEKEFKLLRAGGLGGLQRIIRITKTLFPKKNEVFPPWQGMQYLHNMFTGLPKFKSIDNQRYPTIEWTSIRKVLAAHLTQQAN